MRPLHAVKSFYWIVSLILLAGCGGGGTPVPPPNGGTSSADLQAAVATHGNFTSGQTNASYTITVTNSGNAASSGNVTVTNSPTGFTIATMAGSGWTCTVSSTADSCTTSAAVSPGQSLPAITVTGNVTSTSGTVSIQATVAYNGTSSSASASVTVTAAAALQAAVATQGNFTSGQTNASYTITVTNSGGAASSGSVTVTSSPTGFTIATMAGSGWTCTVSSSADSCTTSTPASAGQSLPAITVTGSVTSTSGTVSIQATVAYNGTSSSASASVTLAPTVNFSVSPSSITLGSAASLSWSSTNAASCTPSGAWSGAIATSGTQAVTPTAASLSIPGFLTYTLTCQNSASTTATGSAILTVTYPTPTGPLTKVRSYEYVALGGVDGPDGEGSLIANSLADLVITGNPNTQVLNKAVVNPTGSKLILGYMNATEAAPWEVPSLFSGSSLPSWFGNQEPLFPGVYTVQYWNPAWETALFGLIDQIAANGYDGIFLDSLTSADWTAGNPEGNPVYPDAVSALATLMTDIRNYVNTTYPGKNFYIVGAYASEVAVPYPSALKSLDVILVENAYYNPGFTGNIMATGYISIYATAYATAGVPIFGVEPVPRMCEEIGRNA